MMPIAALVSEDPRPDLAEDTEYWRQLLRLAYAHDAREDGLARLLYTLRALGGRILDQKGRLRLAAGAEGEYGQAEYARDRDRYLRPYRQELVALLGAAAIQADQAQAVDQQVMAIAGQGWGA